LLAGAGRRVAAPCTANPDGAGPLVGRTRTGRTYPSRTERNTLRTCTGPDPSLAGPEPTNRSPRCSIAILNLRNAPGWPLLRTRLDLRLGMDWSTLSVTGGSLGRFRLCSSSSLPSTRSPSQREPHTLRAAGLDRAGPKTRMSYQAREWRAVCEPDGDAGAGPLRAERTQADSDGAGDTHCGPSLEPEPRPSNQARMWMSGAGRAISESDGTGAHQHHR
jgi:hypothetical protein